MKRTNLDIEVDTQHPRPRLFDGGTIDAEQYRVNGNRKRAVGGRGQADRYEGRQGNERPEQQTRQKPSKLHDIRQGESRATSEPGRCRILLRKTACWLDQRREVSAGGIGMFGFGSAAEEQECGPFTTKDTMDTKDKTCTADHTLCALALLCPWW
jgi:hypothetical protein